MNSSKAYELEHGTDIKPANHNIQNTKYIFVLDFTDGKVYKYNISALCTKENEWNPDSESCESFLYGAGHKVSDCEWMVTNNDNINDKFEDIEYGN